MIAGATTIGEREAAEEALQRLLQNRPAETAEIEAATVPQKKKRAYVYSLVPSGGEFVWKWVYKETSSLQGVW